MTERSETLQNVFSCLRHIFSRNVNSLMHMCRALSVVLTGAESNSHSYKLDGLKGALWEM